MNNIYWLKSLWCHSNLPPISSSFFLQRLHRKTDENELSRVIFVLRPRKSAREKSAREKRAGWEEKVENEWKLWKSVETLKVQLAQFCTLPCNKSWASEPSGGFSCWAPNVNRISNPCDLYTMYNVQCVVQSRVWFSCDTSTIRYRCSAVEQHQHCVKIVAQKMRAVCCCTSLY